MSEPEDLHGSREQWERLREEHQRISSLLGCIRQLAREAIGIDSAPALFTSAFQNLFPCVAFDAGVVVVLEQHLDLYIAVREGEASRIDEALIGKVRDSLRPLIPPTVGLTDVVVKSEGADLPARTGEPGAFDHQAHAVLQIENRTAGVMLLYGQRAFTDADREMLSIYASQLSMLLWNLRVRERILNLAETDDLTGVWNRRYFRRQMPQEVERARIYNVPLSLLIIDIDDFKQINDAFGHTAGDVVLSELCGAMRDTLRPPDLFVRFGGDEFAIVLPHTDLFGASAVSGRILERIRTMRVEADEGTIRCTVSIGVAEFMPAVDASADDVVRRADERLYQAKRAGKDRFIA